MASKKVMFKNTLSDALTEYWTNYIGWGRATRSEYWWSVLFYSMIGGIVTAMFGLDGIWSLVTLVPSFTVYARRLHDTGRSNWNVCWWFLPIIGWIIAIVQLCEQTSPYTNKWGKTRI